MIRNAILLLALVIGTWLCFDGARALLTGSYTTPGTGPYAGQLGPWASLLSSTGIDPTSTGIKFLHLALGTAWLAFGYRLFRRHSSAWWPLLLTALFSLWYLPFGTMAGLAVGGLLLMPSMRRTH